MASFSMGFCKAIILFTSLHFLSVQCVEFKVGGDKGWAIPSSKDTQLYNEWASKNRFNIGDTLRFEYKKDSVLVVTEVEYNKCLSSRPIFFSNNGDTVFKLDRPGLFYFISGVSGHCDRGLKMIIKVLEPENPPPPQSHDDTSDHSTKKSGGAHPTSMIFMIISFVGAFLF